MSFYTRNMGQGSAIRISRFNGLYIVNYGPVGAASFSFGPDINYSHRIILGTNTYLTDSSLSVNNLGSPQWLYGTRGLGGLEIMVTVITGSFGAASSATATWLPLSTIQTWYRPAPLVTQTVNFSIQIRDSASLRVLNTAPSVFLECDLSQGSGGVPSCPRCCFTPDTLITMADGSLRRIDQVIVGDLILSYDEKLNTNVYTPISGVITQVNRVMFEYTFSNGNKLKASDDHPLYVVGKGYASINPTVEYKDLGVPQVIQIGDTVVDENQNKTKIIDIQPIEYSETVYTFENSKFYANGVLVY